MTNVDHTMLWTRRRATWRRSGWAALAVGLALASVSARPAPAWAAASQRSAAKPAVDRSGAPQTGVASFYGKPSQSQTAEGGRMDPSELTAASRTLPLGTKAKVINKDNGRSTAVTITDRGPYAKHRILDVSRRAAVQLGMTGDGVSKVRVVPMHEPAPSAKRPVATR